MAKKKLKLSKKGKKIIVISFSVLLVLIIGIVLICVLNKPEERQEKVPKKQEKEVVEEKIDIINLDSNTRPYAVMINNISTVWGYQSGIQDAYLVYEIIVEGGYTRLMALFKDKTLDRIGSVRSSRHYFLDYALENDAIYVHFGWSPQAQSDMSSLGVNNINFMAYGGYTRDYSLGLASEHTAFTTTNDIMAGADYYGYSKTTETAPLLTYTKSIDLNTLDGAIPANRVYISYSNSRSTTFEYDSTNKVYNRFQNDRAHTDYVTGLQYTTKNIITYQVANYTISGDKKGRQTIENIGNGTGWYISEGYAVPITWEKSSRNSKTVYKYTDGTEIKVNDGNTYIQIQPSGQNLTIE
ncbi:MAG: DUF3048 domain-containing protein [Bacilli bacterium]|nr:DUF3048 domain-containing protein [Bacilli bacterium]